MIEWIRSPIKLLVAIVILAVTLKWLVIPGAFIAMESGTIDRDLEAIQARRVSVGGKIVAVDGAFDTSSDRTFYVYTPTYEARVPHRPEALRAVGMRTSIRVQRGSVEVPASTPKVGDAATLWYDPMGSYVTPIQPSGKTISALWIGLVLLGLGVIGLVITGVLVRLAIRRPTRAPG
ncbi:MAG: hypothetical protein H0T46_31075 [Deltaproteobacteria bacterium]|nr:hypothetical protein [Deltaproteobacteria bacterium]